MTPISIVIPCYNTGPYLAEAVESILRQSRSAAEIIIVDDGSTDAETLRLLNLYEQQGLSVHHTPNRGAPAARNHGVNLATSPFVLCFDSDDVLLPTFLAETAQRLDTMPEVGVAATHIEFFGNGAGLWKPPDYAPSRMLWQNCIPSASLFRKQCWEEVGGYKDLKACQDWEFWISVTVERGWKWVVVPAALCRYRQRTGSISEYRIANGPELMQQLLKLHQAAYQTQLIQILVDINTPSRSASNGLSQPAQQLHSNGSALPELWKVLNEAQRRNQEPNKKHLNLRQIIQATIPHDATVLVACDDQGAVIDLGRNNTRFFPQNEKLTDNELIALLEEMRAQAASFLVIVQPFSAWLQNRPELRRHLLHRYRVSGRLEDSGLIFDLRQPMEQHTFSVVICTYKRDRFLGQAIESVFAQNYPKDRYEIIVINNDSPDNTEEVILRCAGRSPVAFSSYIEKRNGLSFARNLGAEKSQHELVAFLDDDATACPDWLASFNAVINEHHALVVGGRVEKAFEPGFTPPAWFDYQYLKGFFGVNYRDRGRNESVIPIRSPLYLGGGNSAYARRVFDHFGGFDARLGRDGKSLLAGEETYFNLVLESNGIPMYYSDDAYIEHFVESYRLTKSHLRRKACWSGISNAIIQPLFFGYGAALRKTKNNWTEIWDKIRLILRHPRDPENFSHICRMIYNLAFLQKFYRCYLQHKLKREREILPQITWTSEHWLAEVLSWPEGPDQYRELYHYHLFREDRENAHKALEALAAYLGCDDYDHVRRLLESSQIMNQRHHYAALKQEIRQIVNTHLPEKSTVLVVSRGDDDLLRFEDRCGWHFPQIGKNVYAGHYPADSAAAIAHLEALRKKGADFMLFPKTSFWWLDYYKDFAAHLRNHYQMVTPRANTCLLYALGAPAATKEYKEVNEPAHWKPPEAVAGTFTTQNKEANELAYWKSCKAAEGTFSNKHYQQFYTDHFGLAPEVYSDKRVLDIGCGPRGSLEWADMALERIGLDPLAQEYLKLGAASHKMRYVASGSESIPFPDRYFDLVCSFNSLDHVSDLKRTVAEIIRVVKPGGLFLLLSDVNHDPTPCEPIEFSWDIVRSFLPHFDLLQERHFEKKSSGIYQSLLENVPYDHGNTTRRPGIISARFRKRDT